MPALDQAEELLEFVDVLAALTSGFSTIRTPEDLAQELFQALESVMEIRYLGIYLWNPQHRRLELVRTVGFSPEEHAAAATSAWRRHPGEVFRSKQELSIADTRVDPRSSSSARSFQVRSRLYIPILRNEEPLGALGLAHTEPNAFSERHRSLLRFFARLAGVVYGQLCDRMERQLAVEALARANTELQRARDDAMRANRAKSDFLATMSHELRTPLNGIIGYTELAVDLLDDGEIPQAKGDLAQSLRSAHNLLAIINDILDLSKIEAGRLELHHDTVDLVEVAREVCLELAPVAQWQSNRLSHPEGSVRIRGDRDALRRVLMNLVGNALKFTSEGTVEVRCAPRGDRVVVEVEDSGIGMTSEQVGAVFESFAQADGSTRRRFGGTGLGLTITRHLVHAMHGRIEVRSEPGVGSTFVVDLPCGMAEGSSTAPAGDTTAG